MDLAALEKSLKANHNTLPPVESWDPPFCGEIDLQIKHSGQWFYNGTPIGRIKLVKLFASVLKREADNYFLVTPVEKIQIDVEDVPFVITEWRYESEHLVLSSSLGDEVIVSQNSPLFLQTDAVSNDVLPYINVRRNLTARLHQNVFYQLAEIGQEKRINDCLHLCVKSAEQFHSLGVCE